VVLSVKGVYVSKEMMDLVVKIQKELADSLVILSDITNPQEGVGRCISAATGMQRSIFRLSELRDMLKDMPECKQEVWE
jgi:hypothetical protein